MITPELRLASVTVVPRPIPTKLIKVCDIAVSHKESVLTTQQL